MKQLKPAVLSIWYTDLYKKVHKEPQGKFYYIDEKPIFLADMTPTKLWRKFNGYSISKQLLDMFSELKVRPQIIFRLQTTGTLYYAKPSLFTTKGILMAYGGHQQYILPISKFTAKQGDVTEEPKNLPVMDLDRWKKYSTFEISETAKVYDDPKELIHPEVRLSLKSAWDDMMAKKAAIRGGIA